MTYQQLKTIMQTHCIPLDVRLMSDAGWECDPTDMDSVFYHRTANILLFTQRGGALLYAQIDGWKNVSDPT